MNLNAEDSITLNVQTKKIPHGGSHGNSQFNSTEVHMPNSKSFDLDFKVKVGAFIKKINDAALHTSERIISQLLPNGKREGDEWVAINPTRPDHTTGSFKINLNTGVWCDFATSDKGGDIVSFVAYIRGLGQLEAANFLADVIGIERFQPGQYKNLISIKDKKSNTKNDFQIVLPVPDDAEKLDINDLSSFLKVYGVNKIPSAAYEYHDLKGNITPYMLRFELPNGKKYFQPVIFGYDGKTLGWHAKCPLKKIPLYGLEKIISAIAKTILVVEGEKTAEAAMKIFGDNYCVTTSAFGSNGLNKADLTALIKRDIIIFPDNDKAGKKYAHEFAKRAITVGAKSVRIVHVPNEFPEGWDLADPMPTNFSFENISKLLESADPFISVYKNTISLKNNPYSCANSRFRLTDTHLEYLCISKKKSDGSPEEQWISISARIEVIACGRSSESEGWTKLLIFKNREGVTKKWLMPLSMMAGDGREAIKVLHDLGLQIFSGWDKQFKAYLQDTEPTKIILTFKEIGWHETQAKKIYVLPNKVYGLAHNEEFMLDNLNPKHPFNCNESLYDWQMQIARHAIGNSRLILALSAAFAPVFLDLLQFDSGGFHFRGGSSIGKTTLARCAGSVWGGGGTKGYLRQWLATANGLEAISALHKDTLLCIDEIGQIDGNDLGKIVYTLFNGEGKARMKDSISLRDSNSWRLILISSGEISLADKMKEDSKGSRTTKAGMEVRLIDIPADCGKGLGVYDKLPEDFSSAADFSDHLKKASGHYYGTAIHEFFNALMKDIPTALTTIENSMKRIQKNVESIASGQVRRVSDFFVFIAAIGEIAIEYRVLPWPTGEAERGVIECFNAWLRNRGGSPEKTFEELAFIDRVSEFFVKYQYGRFLDLNADEVEKDQNDKSVNQKKSRILSEKNPNHAGYKLSRKHKEGILFYLEPMIFKSEEICASMDTKKAGDILIKLGVLEPDKDGNPQKSVWICFNGRTERKYVFNSKVLELGSTIDSDD